jgi:hypothetical protein
MSVATLFIGAAATPAAGERESGIRIEVLSSPADLISGDDALVRIQVPDAVLSVEHVARVCDRWIAARSFR